MWQSRQLLEYLEHSGWLCNLVCLSYTGCSPSLTSFWNLAPADEVQNNSFDLFQQMTLPESSPFTTKKTVHIQDVQVFTNTQPALKLGCLKETKRWDKSLQPKWHVWGIVYSTI